MCPQGGVSIDCCGSHQVQGHGVRPSRWNAWDPSTWRVCCRLRYCQKWSRFGPSHPVPWLPGMLGCSGLRRSYLQMLLHDRSCSMDYFLPYTIVMTKKVICSDLLQICIYFCHCTWTVAALDILLIFALNVKQTNCGELNTALNEGILTSILNMAKCLICESNV